MPALAAWMRLSTMVRGLTFRSHMPTSEPSETRALETAAWMYRPMKRERKTSTPRTMMTAMTMPTQMSC